MTPKNIAEQVGKTGLCICTDYLSALALKNIQQDFDERRQGEEFTRAGVGLGQSRQVRSSIRTDETYWWTRKDCNSTQFALWAQLDTLQQSFNRNLFLGLNKFEGHYAHYAKNGFYKRHLDAFHDIQETGDGSIGGHGRVISMIIYLNKDWDEANGGKLRLYSAEGHQDVAPIGGTMVCFLSQECEHEVLPCESSRQSFTGWFSTLEKPGSERF